MHTMDMPNKKLASKYEKENKYIIIWMPILRLQATFRRHSVLKSLILMLVGRIWQTI